MALDQLINLDLSAQIAALPKHAGFSTLPARTGETHITLHYSGVAYPPTSHAGELQRILAEAKYQLNHNYGKAVAPAWPDSLLYDLVVLNDGTVVRTRAKRQQLWHAGNATANRRSWAVHLMLGPGQDATPAQWAATVRVFAQLCADYAIPRSHVVGHNEWPRHDGPARPNTVYTILPGQSQCPGEILHTRLAHWRKGAPLPPTPTIPDALEATTLPGPGTLRYPCSIAVAGFYAARGGVGVYGYPLAAETRATGLDKRVCSYIVCERACIKNVLPDGVHLALLSEAIKLRWI